MSGFTEGVLCPEVNMDDFTITTVYFDGQFWCAFIQKQINGMFYSGRYVFGAEPTNPQLVQWMLNDFSYVPLYKTTEYQKIRIKDFVKSNSKPKSLDQYKEAQKEYLIQKKMSMRKETKAIRTDKYRHKKAKKAKG